MAPRLRVLQRLTLLLTAAACSSESTLGVPTADGVASDSATTDAAQPRGDARAVLDSTSGEGGASDAGVVPADGSMLADRPGDSGSPDAAVDLCGGTGPFSASAVAVNQPMPSGIVVAPPFAYWVTGFGPAGTAFIRKVPLGGGAMTTSLTITGMVPTFTADSQYLFVDGGNITRSGLDGSMPRWIAMGVGTADRLVSDGATLFWTGEAAGVVRSVSVAGGGAATIASGQAMPAGLAMAGGALWWVNQGTAAAAYADGSVMRAPALGGTATMVASRQTRPTGIAVTATEVVWTNSGSGTVMRAPLGGGTPLPLRSGMSQPTAIVASSLCAYVADPAAGTITRISLASGVVSVISGQGAPDSIGLSATAVYWTNRTDGRVMRAGR